MNGSSKSIFLFHLPPSLEPSRPPVSPTRGRADPALDGTDNRALGPGLTISYFRLAKRDLVSAESVAQVRGQANQEHATPGLVPIREAANYESR